VDLEIRHHLEERVDRLVAGGMPPDEARQEAERSFGEVGRVQKELRTVAKETKVRAAVARALEALFLALRLAFRALRRSPGFASVAVLTLAIGVGSSATIFTIVNGVLLKPLPFADPDELIVIWSHRTGRNPTRAVVSQPDIEDLREASFVVAVEGVASVEAPLTGVDTPEQVLSSQTTGGLMRMLGVSPQAGRDLRHADNDRDAPRVVVISHDFWQSRLGGRLNVVGSSIQLWDESHEVVGVAPPGFRYPNESYLWIPRRLNTEQCGRGCPIYRGAVARLADGVSMQAAQIEASAIAARASSTFPETELADKDFWLESLLDYEVGDVRRGLWITFGAVGLVLLIVCVNTTNLLLVRGAARTREIAVRSALGAPRGHLALHLLAEVALLTVGGGVLGLLLALGALEWIQTIGTDEIPRLNDVVLDARAFAFLLGVTTSVSLAVGLIPALRFTRRGQNGQLRAQPRSSTTRWGGRRATIMAAEVALSVVALIGAGLLARSLSELNNVDMGFEAEGVTRFSLVPPSTPYRGYSDRVELFARIETAIRELPGVEHVGAVFGAPLTNDGLGVRVSIYGRDETVGAYFRPATAGYFETMRIPLLRGRGFSNVDFEPIAVIDENAARSIFGPNVDPIGRDITMTSILGTRSMRVVGLVPGVRSSPREDPISAIYPLHAGVGIGVGLTFHVKAGPGSTDMLRAIRAEISRIDSRLMLLRPGTVAAAFRSATSRTRLFTTLLVAAAGIAVLLVAIGLYSVLAYVVGRRTGEIGIRMALGARASDVSRMVVRQGGKVVLIGLAIGLVGALLLTRLMEAILFNIRPTDPATYAAVTVFMFTIGLLATYVPARRAARVDPMEALRHE